MGRISERTTLSSFNAGAIASIIFTLFSFKKAPVTNPL